jgi:hypothetical protein
MVNASLQYCGRETPVEAGSTRDTSLPFSQPAHRHNANRFIRLRESRSLKFYENSRRNWQKGERNGEPGFQGSLLASLS